MSVTQKNIINRLEWLVGLLALLLIGVFLRVGYIQSAQGDYYRKLSKKRTLKTDTIYANRGNIYATDGDLLATTVSKYTIRLDLVTISDKLFNKEVKALSDSLSTMFGETSTYYELKLKKAKKYKNRYLLLARGLGYMDYSKIKTFPILNKGPYRGGLIVEQKNVRARPLGEMAVRTVGYADYRGKVGLEGAYIDDLKEHHGYRKKQKIAQGQWKPINDKNEKEPSDGCDVITTIDVDIQDVAHHALLEQLQKFEADHGCAVVMETATGNIRAIANLGKGNNGNYFERINYAVYEAHEPGSTFKVASLLAGLEHKVVDTGNVIDTEKGKIKIYGKNVIDSHRGGYGKISMARVIEVSSNIGIVKMVMKNYKNQPEKFVNKLRDFGFGEKLGIPIKGEGKPYIPSPNYMKKGDKKSWSGLSLPWMSWGYGIKITPLQMLTFYNAIANRGKMVKPKFIDEISNNGAVQKKFETVVMNDKIASQKNLNKIIAVLEDVVKRGTAANIYSPDFSIAGKTGTCQTEYWTGNTQYVSSFSGFFPVKNPKYSCIVVIHKPNKTKGYYGATVAGPVFKAIAQKIYSNDSQEKKVNWANTSLKKVEKSAKRYNKWVQEGTDKMPGVTGMPVMDAIALLENKGLKVNCLSKGYIKKQSVPKGQKINKGDQITLL